MSTTNIANQPKGRLKGRGPFAFALLSLACAVSYAFGPTRQPEAAIHWAPNPANGATVSTTPLVLTSPEPETFRVDLPCKGQWMFDTGPDDGLLLERDQVGVHMSTLDSHQLWPDVPEVCILTFAYVKGVWTVLLDQEAVEHGRAAGGFSVTRLQFSGASDLHDDVEVLLEPKLYGSQPTWLQSFLGVLALGSGLVSSIWLLRRARTPDSDVPTNVYRKPLRASWIDALVVGFILTWVVLAPPFFDDGWIVTVSDNYREVGGFSAYYQLEAAESPTGYWIAILRTLWLNVFEQPVYQRLFVFALLTAIWAGIRGVLDTIFDQKPPRLMAAGAFLVGVVAWGMTFRNEPVIALLSVGVLFTMIAFQRRPRISLLLLATLLSGLSIAAHPVGVVGMAPLLASSPLILAWIRESLVNEPHLGWEVGAVALLAAAWLLLILFLDSSVEHKMATISAFQDNPPHTFGPLSESVRYRLLNSGPFSTPARRGFVAFLLVSVAAWAFRVVGNSDRSTRLPVLSLVVGMGLLAITPSKWPWHFGSLIALLAIALAVELRAMRRSSTTASGILFALGAAFAAAWSWQGSSRMNLEDLVTMSWIAGGVEGLPINLSSAILWAGIAFAVLFLTRWRRSALAAGPEMLATLLCFTLILVPWTAILVDSAITDGWTFPRQNVTALGDRDSCGLADSTVVPSQGSLIRLVSAERADAQVGPSFDGVETASDLLNGVIPEGQEGAYTNWVQLPAISRTLALPIRTNADDLVVDIQFGQRDSAHQPKVLRTDSVEVQVRTESWALYTVQTPAADANVARFRVVDSSRLVRARYAQPLGIETELLSAQDWSSGTTALIHPDLGLFFPCVAQPGVTSGIAQVPDIVVDRWDVMPVFDRAGKVVDYVLVEPIVGQIAAVWVSVPFVTGRAYATDEVRLLTQESHDADLASTH